MAVASMHLGCGPTRTTLRRMGYNSRRPHRVPVISTTNRKKQDLQFARAHQNWTVEDWKNVSISVTLYFDSPL